MCVLHKGLINHENLEYFERLCKIDFVLGVWGYIVTLLWRMLVTFLSTPCTHTSYSLTCFTANFLFNPEVIKCIIMLVVPEFVVTTKQ